MKKFFFVVFLLFLFCASNSFAMEGKGDEVDAKKLEITEEEFREVFSAEFAKYINQFISEKSVEEIKEIVKTKFVPFKDDFKEGAKGEFWLSYSQVPLLLGLLKQFLKNDMTIKNLRVGFKIVEEKKLVFIYDATAVKIENANKTEDEDLGGIPAICPCTIF